MKKNLPFTLSLSLRSKFESIRNKSLLQRNSYINEGKIEGEMCRKNGNETSARTWCSGKTWRERVGREVGGGSGRGQTCEPKAFSFQCMTNFTTKKKKKKKKQEEENKRIGGKG